MPVASGLRYRRGGWVCNYRQRNEIAVLQSTEGVRIESRKKTPAGTGGDT